MKLDIPHIAKLASLPISRAEEKKLAEQLTETLTYVAMLDEIDTENIQPTAHVTGLENVTKEDTTLPSLSQAQAIANAKKTHEGFFVVDAILDNE